jgi:hypothetical protein
MTRKALFLGLAVLIAVPHALRFDATRYGKSRDGQSVFNEHVLSGNPADHVCQFDSSRISHGRHSLRPVFDYSKSHAAIFFVAGCGGHKLLATHSAVIDCRAALPWESLHALRVKLQV